MDTEELDIMNGLRGDQQIHSGTVVQLFKQVNLKMENKDSPDFEEAVDDFFSASFSKGLGRLVNVGIRSVLGNTTMSEYSNKSMLIAWKSNALLRCDTYVLVSVNPQLTSRWFVCPRNDATHSSDNEN